MRRIERADDAESDLLAIWLGVAEKDPAAADRLLREIGRRAELLAEHPMMGRVRSELEPGLRSFAVGSYLIFYRPLDDGIMVMRVLHGSRDLARHFQPPEDEAG